MFLLPKIAMLNTMLCHIPQTYSQFFNGNDFLVAFTFWREPNAWWRHQMETFSRYWHFVRGTSPATGEFPLQRSVAWSFDVFFDLCLNKRLSKQQGRRWFETSSRPLWRRCIGSVMRSLDQLRNSPGTDELWRHDTQVTSLQGSVYI